MHFEKTLLFLLFLLVFFAVSEIGISAQTPAILASTNYVATDCTLHVSGSGFIAFDYVKVFIDDYRDPKFTCYADANGSFDMDMTYAGPYRIPNVQYRFSNSSYTEPSCTIYYQTAEIQPCVNGPVSLACSNVGAIGQTPMFEIRIAGQVGRGGNRYDIVTSMNPNGPWQCLNLIKTNDTWSATNYVWNFLVPQSACGYFRVMGTQCSFQQQ